MKEIGQPIRELDVEPLRYPTALPAAPAEPTPAPPPAQTRPRCQGDVATGRRTVAGVLWREE